MWIVTCGDLADGFVFHGPFDTHDEALEWAEKQRSLADWCIVFLNPVELSTQDIIDRDTVG
jgi:hypothetical protein